MMSSVNACVHFYAGSVKEACLLKTVNFISFSYQPIKFTKHDFLNFYPHPYKVVGVLKRSECWLKRSKEKASREIMASLPSILFAIASPTAGVIPKPCPENPAIYRPSLGTFLSKTEVHLELNLKASPDTANWSLWKQRQDRGDRRNSTRN